MRHSYSSVSSLQAAARRFTRIATVVAFLHLLSIIKEPAPDGGFPVFVLVGNGPFEEDLAEVDNSLEAAIIGLQLFDEMEGRRKGIF